MAKVPYSVETLPKISIVWVGRTNVTDRRQTTDKRQTDGRRHIANVNLGSHSLKIGKRQNSYKFPLIPARISEILGNSRRDFGFRDSREFPNGNFLCPLTIDSGKMQYRAWVIASSSSSSYTFIKQQTERCCADRNDRKGNRLNTQEWVRFRKQQSVNEIRISQIWVVLPRCKECRCGLAVRIPSVCPSVRQTRELWQNGRKICLDFYTIRKTVYPSFLRRRMVGGGRPLLL